MKKLFLSCDGGGSKLNVFSFDSEGNVLSSSTSGGINVVFDTRETVCCHICEALDGCLSSVSEEYILDTVYCIMVSGYDLLTDYFKERGMHPNLRRISEGYGSLLAGTLSDRGCAVIAGTGSGAAYYGGGSENDSLHIGGYGAYLGDDGSGSWIGTHAINAVTAHVDGWGESTALTEKLFDYLNDDNIHNGLYGHELKGRRLYAGFARVVKYAAEDGDDVAVRIMSEAGVLLAKQAYAATAKYYSGCRSSYTSKQRLAVHLADIIPDGIVFCACGGVWNNSLIMQASFCRELEKHLPDFEFKKSAYSPVYAGYILHFCNNSRLNELIAEAQERISAF